MAQLCLGQSAGLRQLPASFQPNNARQFQQPRVCRTRTNGPLQIFANKKVKKTQEVVVTQRGSKRGMGAVGELTRVSSGYFRNYLHPQKLALPATDATYAEIHEKEQVEVKRIEKVDAKAQALATALKTIGKFVIKRRSGEHDKIQDSVTEADVVSAIEAQIGKRLDRNVIVLPEITKLGTYEVEARLHPKVTGKFKLLVQREKEQQKKK